MFGRKKTNRVADDKNWRKLEKDGEKSKRFDKYNLQTQKPFRTTSKRPDYFAVNPHNSRDRIVADAKCVEELKIRHVQQVISYKSSPGFAKRGIIFVAKDTRVPHDVRQYAKEHGITVERRNIQREKTMLDRIDEATGFFLYSWR